MKAGPENKVFSTRNYQFKVQQQKKSTKTLIKVQCKLRVENTLFSRYASKVSNVLITEQVPHPLRRRLRKLRLLRRRYKVRSFPYISAESLSREQSVLDSKLSVQSSTTKEEYKVLNKSTVQAKS